jgi:hypothetical protein
MYRQTVDGCPLSIEQGTAKVPDDGYYYVLLRGEVAGRFRALNKAAACFRELKRTLGYKPPEAENLPVEEIRRREMETMSNKALIWTEEDFARVQRKTLGKKGTRSAG